MNKLTHGIFLVLTLFQMFCTTRVDAQYLNSKSNKMPLSFVSNQYWHFNYLMKQDSSITVNDNMGARIFVKAGLGLLMCSVGGFGMAYLGATITDGPDMAALGGAATGASLGFLLFSSWGVNLVSNEYEQDISYGIVLVGGLAGIISGTSIGYLITEVFTDKNELPIFLGAVVGLFAGEIIFSEIDFPAWDEYEQDHENQVDVNNFTFHEYVKSTQVINFELFNIKI